MSVVVDSSVVVAALVDTGDNGAWAEKILEQGDLYAPELLRVEAANVLRRLERGKEIAEQEANAAFEDLMELDVELHAFEPFSDRVWELRHNVTSYDGWYVALAEALNLPLATLDGRLAKAEGPKCRFLTPESDK
ncbi:MAG: type II toxin-antitoxin system VapC family toxin [Steroidobacteraceae bacterium]